MTGTVRAQLKSRISNTAPRLGDNPNTVIAALVLSTCVSALTGYVVLSKALPQVMRPAATTQLMADAPQRPLPRPGMNRQPLVEPSDPVIAATGFVDPDLDRSRPDAPARQDVAEAPAAGLRGPVRVIEGRPAVVPAPRPTAGAGLVQLARGMTPAAARGLPAPVARPETPADAGVRTVASATIRPETRPVTLSTRSLAASEAEVVLAAAATPEGAPRPRQSDPVPPRAGANPCAAALTRAIPRRPGSAPGGAAVMEAVGNGSGSGRDNALVAEALRGNVPGFLRDLQPVRFNGMIGGRRTEITLCVTPDYLAIGSDTDHVRVPLGLPAALRVADAFEMMLPTTRMVDAIYAQADVRVAPAPMPPTSAMSSTDYFLRHDATVDAQFARAGARAGVLVAGHKKDLVLSNRLSRAPGRVAIYGWHRTSGDAIQPLSTVHGEYYADYSHGIRLVARTAYVNGRAVDLRGLLTDGQYAGLLNSEGPLTGTTVRLAALQ